ncbi:hypothetical protein BH11PSE10_BH11PSE10_15080 [soil metagenome]
MRFKPQTGVKRRAALAMFSASLLAASAGQALAQDAPRRFAAISLIGNDITSVSQQSVTGTKLDRNLRDSFTVPGNLFDLEALGALNEAVVKADPKAVVLMLKLPSADIFGPPDQLFDGDKFLLPAALAPALKQTAATHLLIVTRLRAQANIKTAREGIGAGMLEGLGFYVNNEQYMQRTESSEVSIGYLAPFTYVKLTLVNLATGKVERTRQIAHAQEVSSERKEGLSNPWDFLTTVEKVQLLRQMLNAQIKAAVPALIAQP